MWDVKTVIARRGRGGYFWFGHDIENFVSKSFVIKASVDNETRNAIKIYEKSLGVIISYWNFSEETTPLVLVNDEGCALDILHWNDPIVPDSDGGGCGKESFKTEGELFAKFRSVLLELDRIFDTSLTELRMRLEISGRAWR